MRFSWENAFRIAVEQGHVSLANFLLSLGASSGLPSDILWVALRSKLSRRKSEMVDFLINQGANVFAKARNADTLLHFAVASIDNYEVLQIVWLLFRQGCDPALPNNSGVTPFHVAVERGRISVVELFLSLNVHPPPDILFTAIESSTALSSDVILEMIDLLVSSGCDIQTRNAEG